MTINRSDYPPVPLRLVGLDGNAFSLMGAFQRAARKVGWPEEAIEDVLEDCRSANYDHLLSVLVNVCVEPDDDEE